MDKNADPTNPVLLETIETLEKQEAAVWKDVADKLGRVNRRRPEVNLSDIERVAEEGETIVVPGKVLGSGRLTKEVRVAAFDFSSSARNSIDEEGDSMFIRDLLDERPDGRKVKIVE